MTSNHWTRDRKERDQIIERIGDGRIIRKVVIDKHHPNGPEVHVLSNTGIITIFNQKTNKMITKLIARPGQLNRFYANNTAPKWLVNITREHQRMGLNLV